MKRRCGMRRFYVFKRSLVFGDICGYASFLINIFYLLIGILAYGGWMERFKVKSVLLHYSSDQGKKTWKSHT